VNTSNHYTSQPLTTERVAALDRTKMLAFYRDRFDNAADFTFFMVGAIRLDAAIPLLAQYVGSLPSTAKRTAQYKDLEVRFPSGIERVRVEKGREPRSQTVISFFADPPPDAGEQERITAATTVLSTALRDVLREELGQTYTVSVGLSQSWPQRGGGHIRVSFGAAPENIQSMTERVLQEIRRLQQEGPSADLTARAKESARRGYETSLRQNAYWLGRLQTVHMMGGDPREILTRSQRIDAVTPALLQEVFKKYFPLDRYTAVTLMPEVAGQ
jgi:zinc protease